MGAYDMAAAVVAILHTYSNHNDDRSNT